MVLQITPIESAVKRIYRIAEVKLTYVSEVKPSERAKISGSREVAEVFWDYFEDTVEHIESFYVLLLSRANKVLGIKLISLGGVAGTVADPKVIFQTALLGNASSIIVCHNHPSGNLSASQADIQLTKRLVEAGKLLEIQVVDHIILTPEKGKHFSFADEGLI